MAAVGATHIVHDLSWSPAELSTFLTLGDVGLAWLLLLSVDVVHWVCALRVPGKHDAGMHYHELASADASINAPAHAAGDITMVMPEEHTLNAPLIPVRSNKMLLDMSLEEGILIWPVESDTAKQLAGDDEQPQALLLPRQLSAEPATPESIPEPVLLRQHQPASRMRAAQVLPAVHAASPITAARSPGLSAPVSAASSFRQPLTDISNGSGGGEVWHTAMSREWPGSLPSSSYVGQPVFAKPVLQVPPTPATPQSSIPRKDTEFSFASPYSACTGTTGTEFFSP